jgi:hypothetical protein
VTTSLSSANPGKSMRTRCSHCAGRRTDVRDSPQSWLPGQYLVEHIESTAIYPAFHQCALGNEERRYPLLSPGSVRSVADGGPASGSSPEGSRIPAARSTTPAPRRFGLLLVISPTLVHVVVPRCSPIGASRLPRVARLSRCATTRRPPRSSREQAGPAVPATRSRAGHRGRRLPRMGRCPGRSAQGAYQKLAHRQLLDPVFSGTTRSAGVSSAAP